MTEHQRLLEEHKKATGKDAVIIGLFWDRPEKVHDGLRSSIKRHDPYNEYEMLTDRQKKLFDRGVLKF